MPALVAGMTPCFIKGDKVSIKSPLIPAKAGIQDELGPRFRGDERTLKARRGP